MCVLYCCGLNQEKMRLQSMWMHWKRIKPLPMPEMPENETDCILCMHSHTRGYGQAGGFFVYPAERRAEPVFVRALNGFRKSSASRTLQANARRAPRGLWRELKDYT